MSLSAKIPSCPISLRHGCKATTAGVIQPGKEKARIELIVDFQYVKETYKKDGKRSFTGA